MKNSVRVLNICLILGMTLFTVSANANDLNKLDIKRSSSSASTLNVTVYTANPYDENIAVSKKDDNKYVILMPNVTGSNSPNVDFSSIKDVVSNVDVKSVSDGENSYTKVILTTTKPVSINTSTRKSAPLTDEQKAYKNLIAQTRNAASNRNNTSNNTSASTTSTAPKSYIITADGISTDTSSLRPKSVVEQVKMLVKDNGNKSAAKDTVSNVPTTAIAFGTSGISESNNSLLSEKPIDNKKQTSGKTAKTDNNVSHDKTNTSLSENDTETDTKGTEVIENSSPLLDAIQNNKDITNLYKTKHKKFNQNFFTTIILLLLSVTGLLYFFKNIKKSLEHSAMLKKTFKENLHAKPVVIGDYSNIANDTSLNWQEKYHKFVNSIEEISAETAIQPIGNGEYEFVNSANIINENQTIEKGYSEILNTSAETDGSAALKPKEFPVLKSYNKPAMNYSPDNITSIKKVKNPDVASIKDSKKPDSGRFVSQNRGKTNFKEVKSYLEKTYTMSPSVERLDTENDDIIIKQLEESFKSGNIGNGFVINEEDIITESLRRSPKLRTFANKIALEETKRKTPSPKQRSEIIRTKYIEAKQVNMDNSALYSPTRRFADANLSSADLLSGSNFKITGSNKVSNPITNNNQQYSTVSVDDYFDAVDSSSRVTASASLASRVADRLGKMSVEFVKPSDRKQNTVTPKRNILTGKIVKTGYNINNDSGFYIVENEDGTSSLIGRVKDQVTVLKDFGDSKPDKLQVRKDNDNVYIVRVAGERYMVEMTDSKMAMLLEL